MSGYTGARSHRLSKSTLGAVAIESQKHCHRGVKLSSKHAEQHTVRCSQGVKRSIITRTCTTCKLLVRLPRQAETFARSAAIKAVRSSEAFLIMLAVYVHMNDVKVICLTFTSYILRGMAYPRSWREASGPANLAPRSTA